MGPEETGTKISTAVDPSQSANSSPTTFLDLPKPVREKIYETVLDISHPIHLFQEPGCSVDAFAPDKPPRWLALLYTNRQISTEAKAVLYKVNRFELVDITAPQIGVLRSFLDCIGTANAASIYQLAISFPSVLRESKAAGNLKLNEDSLQCLEILHDRCTALSTLETVVHYRNGGFLRKPEQFLREALTLVDGHLKSICSLRKVVVRFEDPSTIQMSAARNMMQQLGWVVLFSDGNPS